MRAPIGALVAVLLTAACGGSDPLESGPEVTFVTVPSATATTATTATTQTTGEPPTTAATVPPTEPTVPTVPLVPSSIVFTPFVEGFTDPVDIAWRAGDDTAYVVEQDGRIVPVRNGRRGAPVLDVVDTVANGGEQGLLGLAFHPTEPLAYVNYVANDEDTVIAEYSVAPDGTFDPGSARQVLTVEQPYSNHNGGEVVFGPDGFLYIGLGDGGSGGDPERRALNVSELLGKILRIDPRASGDQPYTVPADNPFVGVAGARPEVWSVGLRNPWKFDFDAATGDLWIGDVGQNAWEEVDVAWAQSGAGAGKGMNFGWSAYEGTHRFNWDPSPEGVTMPIYEYPHGDAGCSVSGGTVYRGDAVAALVGWYVFSDFCSGRVTALSTADRTLASVVELGDLGSVSAIIDGPDGALYVLGYDSGIIHRIDPA